MSSIDKETSSSDDVPRQLVRTPAIQSYYGTILSADNDRCVFESHTPFEEPDDDNSSSNTDESDSESRSVSYQPTPVSLVKQQPQQYAYFPRFTTIMIFASLMYSLSSYQYGNATNTAAGVIVAGVFFMASQISDITNPTPQVRAKIILLLLIYTLMGILWGNVRLYEYITTTTIPIRYWRFIDRNTWRMLLWPGDSLMFIIRSVITKVRV